MTVVKRMHPPGPGKTWCVITLYADVHIEETAVTFHDTSKEAYIEAVQILDRLRFAATIYVMRVEGLGNN